jgi:hypothetical protein
MSKVVSDCAHLHETYGWDRRKTKTNILLTRYDSRAPQAAKHKKIPIFTDEAPDSVNRVIRLFMWEYQMGKPI